MAVPFSRFSACRPSTRFGSVVAAHYAERRGGKGLAAALSTGGPLPMPVAVAHFRLQQQQREQQQAAQDELLVMQQQLTLEGQARARLQQQLAAREAVIGQLARRRDDATASRLASYESAWQRGEQRLARAVAGLASQRQQYALLAASLATTVNKLEEAEEPPCTCCGGSRPAAAGVAVFEVAAQEAHLQSQAAGWQAEACELQLEVTHCQRTLEEAGAELAYMERCMSRVGEEARGWERRAQAAEAALVRARAESTLLREQVTKQAAEHQAGGVGWRHMDSSRSFQAIQSLEDEAVATNGEAAGHDCFTISASRASLATEPEAGEQAAAERPLAAAASRHTRSPSGVFC